MLYIFRTAEDVAQINPFVHCISFHFILLHFCDCCVSREVGKRLELGCMEMRYITVLLNSKGLETVCLPQLCAKLVLGILSI